MPHAPTSLRPTAVPLISVTTPSNRRSRTRSAPYPSPSRIARTPRERAAPSVHSDGNLIRPVPVRAALAPSNDDLASMSSSSLSSALSADKADLRSRPHRPRTGGSLAFARGRSRTAPSASSKLDILSALCSDVLARSSSLPDKPTSVIAKFGEHTNPYTAPYGLHAVRWFADPFGQMDQRLLDHLPYPHDPGAAMAPPPSPRRLKPAKARPVSMPSLVVSRPASGPASAAAAAAMLAATAAAAADARSLQRSSRPSL
ncbi:hypothetical protein HK105_205660 [Polyrhizophydium stewartii]|uniref:Uncharacterized protein n=1 Tax=Polyrhizophydium stewartii TaxID=2732419 RepID=A0ABR4N5H5_9FUNG